MKAIHFDFDKSDIRPEDAKILESNAAWLKVNPGQLLMIEGHSDERGTVEYNCRPRRSPGHGGFELSLSRKV